VVGVVEDDVAAALVALFVALELLQQFQLKLSSCLCSGLVASGLRKRYLYCAGAGEPKLIGFPAVPFLPSLSMPTCSCLTIGWASSRQVVSSWS
jgi:hypothetical protein